MSQIVKAHLALFTVALIYGANYSIAKIVLDDGYLQPKGFILLRALTNVLLVWLVHGLFIREAVKRQDLFRLFICGVFGVVINQVFFFSGLKLTTPINAALIMTTTPILVLIASAIIIGEGITFRKVTGVILGASGAILLISYGKDLSFHKDQIWGNILVFINATSYGIYLVLVKTLMDKYHPLTVVKWVFTFSIIFLLPLGMPDLLIAQWSSFPSEVWWAIIYVLIATTFLAYMFNAFALKTVNPSVVSIYIYLQPVLATIIALAFARDHLDMVKIISAVLIFGGVYLVSFRKKEGK